METLKNCQFCGTAYDTTNRVPYTLFPCSHFACEPCTKQLRMNGSLCTKNHHPPAEIKDYLVNQGLLEELQTQIGISIHCKQHPTTVADFFLESTQNFICANCAAMEEIQSNLIPQDQKNWTQQGELLCEYAATIEKQVQKMKQIGQAFKDKTFSYSGDQVYKQVLEAVKCAAKFNVKVNENVFSLYMNQCYKEIEETQIKINKIDQEVDTFNEMMNQTNVKSLFPKQISIKLIDILSNNSEILKNQNDYILKLAEWIDAKYISGHFLYRGSRDGFKAADFHEKCDNKGPTLSIIRSDSDQVFGGFTSKHFCNSNTWCNKADAEAFLFTLNRKTKLFLNPEHINLSVRSHGSYLLAFGGGFDLIIHSQCDQNTNSSSDLGHTYELPEGISYNSAEAFSYLAGVANFKVSEIEVFELQAWWK